MKRAKAGLQSGYLTMKMRNLNGEQDKEIIICVSG